MSEMICPWWLCYSFDNPLRRFFHDPERLLAPHVKTGATVVDIGCGMGYFTIAMARLAGPDGTVIAVDLQQRMLDVLGRRARKAGVAERIVLRRCSEHSLEVAGPADFALAFWMCHEVPDKARFFTEIHALLTPGGRLLLVEPKLHVTRGKLGQTLALSRESGFDIIEALPVALSRAYLLKKKDETDRE